MKKYPKIIQSDSRGQIVIPKDIRHELGITEGTGFYIYSITGEGILFKKIPTVPLEEQDKLVSELNAKADKIGIAKGNITKSVKRYTKPSLGRLEEI